MPVFEIKLFGGLANEEKDFFPLMYIQCPEQDKFEMAKGIVSQYAKEPFKFHKWQLVSASKSGSFAASVTETTHCECTIMRVYDWSSDPELIGILTNKFDPEKLQLRPTGLDGRYFFGDMPSWVLRPETLAFWPGSTHYKNVYLPTGEKAFKPE